MRRPIRLSGGSMTLGSIVKAPLGSDSGVITRAALGPHRAAVHVARGGPLYRASSQPRVTTTQEAPLRRQRREPPRRAPLTDPATMLDSSADALLRALNRAYTRSEERRVGKEGRSRGWQCDVRENA